MKKLLVIIYCLFTSILFSEEYTVEALGDFSRKEINLEIKYLQFLKPNLNGKTHLENMVMDTV